MPSDDGFSCLIMCVIAEAIDKRAAYVEKMKNKMAEIHKSGEEKRAVVVAKKREDQLFRIFLLSSEQIGTTVTSTCLVLNYNTWIVGKKEILVHGGQFRTIS
ncbi:hypothetical protein POM88_041053 [Heracleum sosnowskyi]|uniref:Uncharacterized protein n=1 Tax=Heracleum sosnowskyi TaxID=360622 RepID=A0AAD8MAD8_9APIA|nr:hypothetical protein POM88_041053 [Heracleum sosnowskyi]